MNLYLQIIVYILVTISLYLTAITFFDDKIIDKKYFSLNSQERANIEIWLVINNIDEDKAKKVEKIVENGEYNSIYDITANFYIKNKSVDI